MRMKLNKSRQLGLVSAASLAAALLVTACSQFTETLTVDFVYVASQTAAGPNQYGQIDVFEINSESGRMRKIPASPFPSGGREPVAEAVSADYGSLFVSNQDDNTIVQFVIGSDGKLYPFNTVNTPGIYPAALAANKSDLFSVALYQPLPTCSTAAPCAGAVAVFPLLAGGSAEGAPCAATVCIGPPAANASNNANYWPLTVPGKTTDVVVPTGVNVAASGAYVYVSAYDSSVLPSVGYVFGFSVAPPSTSTVAPGGTCPASGPIAPNSLPSGTLCPLPGSPFVAGVQPSAIASDASSSYVYVTDHASAEVLGFSISSGSLTPLTSGTSGSNAFPAGNDPSSIVVDPSYPYVYVTNALDSTVTAYSMSGGALSPIANYETGTEPVAIGVDPSTNHFLFTANFLGNDVSGFQLSTTDGSLLVSQFSPYASDTNPVAVAAIPHNGTGGGIEP